MARCILKATCPVETPMNPVMLLIGLLLTAAGLLFVGQGSGLIAWPASSFMIRRTKWIYYGGAIAAAGVLLVVFALR